MRAALAITVVLATLLLGPGKSRVPRGRRADFRAKVSGRTLRRVRSRKLGAVAKLRFGASARLVVKRRAPNCSA